MEMRDRGTSPEEMERDIVHLSRTWVISLWKCMYPEVASIARISISSHLPYFRHLALYLQDSQFPVSVTIFVAFSEIE